MTRQATEMHMADFQIRFMSVKQTTYGSPTCKVLIVFEITGPKSGVDIAQIYAVNAVNTTSNGLGDVVDTIDLTITEFQYSSLVDLQSGAAYTLALCPRSKTGDVLDDKVEGEYLESFCIFQPFVTELADNPLVQINVDSAEPATLLHSNQITISWSSSNYTDGQVLWGPQTSPHQHVYSFQPGHKGTEPDYTGKYTATIPANLANQVFSFTVQVRNQLQDANLWVKNTVTVRSARNYYSLRQLLLVSNVPLPAGVRQYLHGTRSLRTLMQI
jgi:hypothetical protein